MDRVVELKGQGNSELQKGNYTAAIATYDEVLKLINADHDQWAPVNGNKALACMKAERWAEGVEAAEAALKALAAADATKCALYQKAVYRKGVCHRGLNHYNLAIESFQALLSADPSNEEAGRRLRECQAQQKKSNMRYGAMFKESFYDDRVKATEELKHKQMAEYEQSKKGEETFEEWLAAKTAAEEAERKKKQKEAPPVSLLGGGESASTATPPSKKNSEGVVELELDEEDRQILKETKSKGYCYFRRELTEDEKQLKDTVHVPQRIGNEESAVPAPPTESPQRGVSSWNNGTTYEEKDTTSWCKTMIKSYLSAGEAPVPSSSWLVKLTGCEEPTGDAQIMVVRSSLRHFFDMAITVNFEVTSSATGERIGTGVFKSDSVTGALDTREQSFFQSTPTLHWNKENKEQLHTALKHLINNQLLTFYNLYKQKR